MKKLMFFGAFFAAIAPAFVANADGSGTFDTVRGEPKTSDLGGGYIETKCNPKPDECAIVYTAPNGLKYFRPLDRLDGIWYEVLSAPSAPIPVLTDMFVNEGVEGHATDISVEP